MFIRKKRNKSGSTSIQIISKSAGNYRVVKSIGCAKTAREEELLILMARTELERLVGSLSLFIEHDDLVVESFVDSISNDHLQVIGSELILGKIYDKIGFPKDGCPDYFKSLVLCRLVYPSSKLKTVEYFKKHLNIEVSVYTVYRFLDELNSRLKLEVEQIAFEHTKSLLKGKIGVVFYDMTTLYFEASDEDDYRIIGYSKDGNSRSATKYLKGIPLKPIH